MGIFPSWVNNPQDTKEELPIYEEIAWDYERNTPIIENGEFKRVTGAEAIKTWCYRSLRTERFKYLIYSWNYGSEFEGLIGKKYSNELATSECSRYVKECLMVNPYIKGVSNITSKFFDGLLTISCKIDTIYRPIDLEVNRDI